MHESRKFLITVKQFIERIARLFFISKNTQKKKNATSQTPAPQQ
jgi:hypothetical protein